MATFETKWTKLWTDFQNARKNEWLKAEEVGNFNKMMKEVPRDMKVITKALDEAEVQVSSACSSVRGFKPEDAPGYLAKFVSNAKVLAKGTHKALVKKSYDDMDKAKKPRTYRALKVLMTGMDEISSLAQYKAKALKDQVDDIGKQLSSQQRIAQVHAKALDQVKKGAMKSLACLQKVKANPTPKAWKEQMGAGMTRDLIMGLTTLQAAQKKGDFGDVPKAGWWKSYCDPWNTGQAKTKVQDT
ncbi:MAG: hypothetical protein D6754_04405, partial [Alphaproteobacteria bacterium]